MENKKFQEVFPELKISNELSELLNYVQIERITTNRDRTGMRIYIFAERLILRKNIVILEKAIKEQLFKHQNVNIKIMEKYALSEQYDLAKLLNIYRDSIIAEIKDYNMLMSNIYRKAEYVQLTSIVM